MICTLCTKRHLEHGTLCPECTRDTLDRLHRLPRMWASLEAWLTPGRTGTAQYGGRVRRAEAPLPLSEEVLDLRAAGGIVGVLEDWHAAVCDTRGMPVPARASSLQSRITAAAAALADQIHFIVLWEQGGQLAREVARLVDRVRTVVQPGRALDEPPEPTFLGRCIAVDEDGTVCGHRLYADMTRPVQCSLCLCPYPPDTWLALRRYQPGATPPVSSDGPALEPAA
ncbi:hypothetical protein [Streptomyces canus]|uniref:hypothetical protein n=1 Tax=Streptomyces canus TaxID=58343 RepID=UPI003866806A|nr:hypothetical protein OH824_17735 [Streptomyces canus]